MVEDPLKGERLIFCFLPSEVFFNSKFLLFSEALNYDEASTMALLVTHNITDCIQVLILIENRCGRMK